jgi:dTDP-4-amino-4,6-dideoxygalactose transaminase
MAKFTYRGGGAAEVEDLMKRIPLIKPYITEEVKQRVCDVLDSGYLTEGSVTEEFEESFKDYIGCKHAIAVCNCTVGLETALRVLGIGPGDEVIVPDYTYPATASVVEIVGAKIVLVDIDPETMLIDCEAIEAAITSKTKAVMPVSIFGNPLDYEQLMRLKARYGFYIVEDAACSIGAKINGKCVGNMADISVFSLHPRKFITTGEGGIITTNDANWAEWIESYKHFGMGGSASRASTRFERIGTNYKLSNIQAAVGLVQMQHIDMLLDRRRQQTKRYSEMLYNQSGVKLPKTTTGGAHSWQSFCIFVQNRDEIIRKLKTLGIETQIGTYALHLHKAYFDNPNCRITSDMSGSRYAFEHCLTLPLYHDMTAEEQDFVIKHLIAAL